MSDFNDMRLRVVNAAPCDVEYQLAKPPCFPYGVLLFTTDTRDESLCATFGDLSITVTAKEAFELLMIAQHKTQWKCVCNLHSV